MIKIISLEDVTARNYAVGQSAKLVLGDGSTVSAYVLNHYADGRADLSLSFSGSSITEYFNVPGLSLSNVSGSVSGQLLSVSYGDQPGNWYLVDNTVTETTDSTQTTEQV